jgi:Tol biopolymer transport system component
MRIFKTAMMQSILVCALALTLIGQSRGQALDLSLISTQQNTTTQTANAASTPNEITPDGRWLLFTSAATNLVPGQIDTNNGTDVFLFDRNDHSTLLVSRSLGLATTAANTTSTARAISADGRWIVYISQATDIVSGLTDNNGSQDVFLFDRIAATTTLISRALGASNATANNFSNAFDTHAISADGAYIVFMSRATNILPGVTDNNGVEDLFLFERATATTTLISGALGSSTMTASNQSLSAGMSDDGRWILFSSSAGNLINGVTDINGTFDSFIYDRSTSTTTLVSRALGSSTTSANGQSTGGTITPSGEWVVYTSNASNIVNGISDNNAGTDAFVFNRLTGVNVLISRSSVSPNAAANEQSQASRASADGRWIVFSSLATDVIAGLVDSNGVGDVYLYDRVNASSVLLSRALGAPTTTANARSLPSRISADGRWSIYRTLSTNILSGLADSNGTYDVYLFDRDLQTSTLLSRSATTPTATANGESTPATLNADGSRVVLFSLASDLIAGVTDANAADDVFVAAQQAELFANGFED